VDWKQQKLVKLEQVCVGHKRDVEDECELRYLGVILVRNLHLEEARSIVDEVDHVHFPHHGQCVVQDFIQNVMWKCPWSQSVMLGRFDHVFVVMTASVIFVVNQMFDSKRSASNLLVASVFSSK